MALKLVMVVVKMIDICAVSQQSMPQLFVIEQTDQVKEGLIRTHWYNCNYSIENDTWNKKQIKSYYLPQTKRIYAELFDHTIYAVQQSNIEDALYVMKSESDEKCKVEALNLSIESSNQINVSSSGAWSTPFLPMEQCLFNPHIHLCSNREVIVSANAVDASARIFQFNTTKVKEIVKIENCSEPCFIEVTGKKIVMGRKTPEDWPVFYNQPETRLAPELLPLTAYLLDHNYKIDDTINLSKGWITGGSYAFDGCSSSDGKLILATVSGLLKKPFLQILLSPDAGVKWKEYATLELEEVPQKLKVAATSSRILVACTFKKYDGYHVMAAEFDR